MRDRPGDVPRADRRPDAGAHGSPHTRLPARPGFLPVHGAFTAWHSETEGANRSEPERTSDRQFLRYARTRALTDVTSETLRRWREARGWDVPRMARELRKAARDSGEDIAAHHGLVKMIPQWE